MLQTNHLLKIVFLYAFKKESRIDILINIAGVGITLSIRRTPTSEITNTFKQMLLVQYY